MFVKNEKDVVEEAGVGAFVVAATFLVRGSVFVCVVVCVCVCACGRDIDISVRHK